MRRFADLHTHSCVSDGMMSPEELVQAADAAGLGVLALTDHDTVEGLHAAGRAAEPFEELRFIPGVEISARYSGGTMHLLGLRIDPRNETLASLLAEFRTARDQRNPQMLQKLQQAGIQISMDDILACIPERRRGGIVSRLHFAKALVNCGAAKNIKDAFARWIGPQGAAYVEKDRIEPAQAINAIRAAGGVAVLAHPVQLNCPNPLALETLVKKLQHAGLRGIEAYHSDHSPDQTRQYLDLANRRGLFVSGGSDFHGQGKPAVQLGYPRVPVSQVSWLEL